MLYAMILFLRYARRHDDAMLMLPLSDARFRFRYLRRCCYDVYAVATLRRAAIELRDAR